MTTPSAPKGETKYHDITTGRCPHCGSVGDDGFRYHRCQVMAEAELAAATERLEEVRHWLAFYDNTLIAAGMQKACDDLAAALEVKP